MAVNELDRDYLRILHTVDTMEDIMSGLKMQEATDAEKKKQVGNIVMSLEGELLDTKWTEAGKDMTRVSDGAAAGRVYWKS